MQASSVAIGLVAALAGCACAGVEPLASAPVQRTEASAAQTPVVAAPMSAAEQAVPGGASEPVEPPSAPSAPAPAPAPEPRAFQQPLPDRTLPASAPALRIANMSPTACRAELRARKLSAVPGRKVPGVATPMRLTGAFHGVRYAGPGSKSASGVLDCRLVLALDALAPVLAEAGVSAVHVGGFYRARARLPGKKAPSQHARGLAMDVVGFTLIDGTRLDVERDWGGTVSEPACGPDARPSAPTEETTRIRDVVCALGRSRIFHHVLTPGFDAAHRAHLHIDLKRGSNLLVVR